MIKPTVSIIPQNELLLHFVNCLFYFLQKTLLYNLKHSIFTIYKIN
jgi:hypothetical protein